MDVGTISLVLVFGLIALLAIGMPLGFASAILAVLMAAMSGIIGGEVVLLGLIALPQMLRLGYNQNLAIGTICASGSLGTMIPPSIVLIIYGLITETSIKSLFTAAFVPGFMLAMFIIIYIIIRTQLRPEDAPLEEDTEDFSHFGVSSLVKWAFVAIAGLAAVQFVMLIAGSAAGGITAVAVIFGVLPVILAVAFAFLARTAKGQLFLSFTTILILAVGLIMVAYYIFLLLTGRTLDDNEVRIDIAGPMMTYGIAAAVAAGLLVFGFGKERAAQGWSMGRSLVAPIVVIGVVLGSIYGGITGITEAAGMGTFAVLILAIFRGEASWDLIWESLLRTLKSTGTIIWVTVGAAALAGAYTIAGGPRFVAELIVGSDMPSMLILLTMMVILLFMGAFMDWVGIVLLIIPVFLPIVLRLPIEDIGFFGQLDPKNVSIWFGVLFCMNMQVSFLSPPFGPAAFYLKSVAPPHIALTDIFKGFLPFIGIQLLALSVLLIWPSIIEVLL